MESINELIQTIQAAPDLGKWFMAVFGFVLADLISGLANAYKKGEAIKASGLKNTTVKIIQLSLALITTEVISILFVPGIALAKIVAGYICLTEAKSIFENIQKTTGIDLWRKITGSAPINQNLNIK